MMRLRSGTIKFVMFLVCILIFALAGRYLNLDPQTSRAFFSRFPLALSSIIFVVLYVVGTFFIWFGPKDVLRVASLFIFGVVWSSVLVYIGEMLNMVTMFWFSRRLGRPFFDERAPGKWQAMRASMGTTRAPVIFFMKFYPIIPFRFLDLAYGLTTISFLKYAAVSVIAAPIRLYVIQYFLDLMIRFGLTAVQGDAALFMQRYLEMTQYLVDRPALFGALALYTFSAILFFIILMTRRKRRSA